MKVLVIHNFHQDGSASGDDTVFRNETKLLEKKGNTVYKYSVSNNEYFHANLFGKLHAVSGIVWSKQHYNNVRELIRREKPDIVHVHTFFPLLSPSVLVAAKKEKVKVVATLHDTRFICPVCTSLRGNVICNDCIDGKYFRMCKYKCFKNSRLKSFALAIVFKIFRKKQIFKKYIDSYICLNDIQKKLLIKAGYEEERIEKKYNFVSDPSTNSSLTDFISTQLPTHYFVFYGRIGEEKGIRYLMDMWKEEKEIPLVVMGSGPLEEVFREFAKNHKSVYFLGYTEHDKCLKIVKQSRGVLFPSIWYEGCSMVEIEAESLGKPLITFDVGFSSEAIEDGYNGYKVPLKNTDAFMERVRLLWNNPELSIALGKNARNDYLKKYTPDNNYIQLRNIYQRTINENENEN